MVVDWGETLRAEEATSLHSYYFIMAWLVIIKHVNLNLERDPLFLKTWMIVALTSVLGSPVESSKYRCEGSLRTHRIRAKNYIKKNISHIIIDFKFQDLFLILSLDVVFKLL